MICFLTNLLFNVRSFNGIYTPTLPVLVIYENKDDIVPLKRSKEAMQFLPKESKLEIIKGGDHTLNDKMNKIIALFVNWFSNPEHPLITYVSYNW